MNFTTDFYIAYQHFHLFMGVPEKSGIAGLAVEQNDGTESGLALHSPLEVETGLLDGLMLFTIAWLQSPTPDRLNFLFLAITNALLY